MSSDRGPSGAAQHPPGRRARVLIVDDSSTIRRLLREQLSADPRLEVVGEAADPIEARSQIKSLSPDVLTLDVEMPGMNGLDFLEKLMRLRPMPVVMISTETHRGSAAAIEALALGAVDCIGKPSSRSLPDARLRVADTVAMAATAHVRPRAQQVPAGGHAEGRRWSGQIVLIGASTGGVEAIETVLAGFPSDCPPTLIAQHMPAAFLASFASRLASRVRPRLKLAGDGDPIVQGQVYLAPGGETHLQLQFAGAGAPRCLLLAADKRNGHRPSVDVLFESALPLARRVVAVMLTGMGRDGAVGMRVLRNGGARCIAQDEETSVVYGMPRAAVETGGGRIHSAAAPHRRGRA